MMGTADWSNPYFQLLGLVVASAGAMLVGWRVLFARSPRIDSNRLPPAPKMRLSVFLKQLLSPKGPAFALKMAREFDYIFLTPSMMNLYWIWVGEPELGRQILEDPRSGKLFLAYKVFDKAASGETFFSQNGLRGQHVRKSTAAFGPAAVKQMAIIVEQVIDEWVETRLDPL
jgi:cytochrome P450